MSLMLQIVMLLCVFRIIDLVFVLLCIAFEVGTLRQYVFCGVGPWGRCVAALMCMSAVQVAVFLPVFLQWLLFK